MRLQAFCPPDYGLPRRYEAVSTADWIHWRAINNEISLPAHAKHGSFLEITAAEAARLVEAVSQ